MEIIVFERCEIQNGINLIHGFSINWIIDERSWSILKFCILSLHVSRESLNITKKLFRAWERSIEM